MIMINLSDQSREVNLDRYVNELGIKTFGRDIITGAEFISNHISSEELVYKTEARSVRILNIET